MFLFRLLHSPAPAMISAALLAAPAAWANDAKIPEMKTFGAWYVGCDNARRCTAIGTATDYSIHAYVTVKRDGAADAPVQVSFAVTVDSADKASALTMELDGKPPHGLSKASWPVQRDQGFGATLDLDGRDAAILLPQLRDGKLLTLKLVTPDGATLQDTVSLTGAAAALLYVDDQQQRVGTVTALVKPGTAPASTVPPPPPLPYLNAHVMKKVENPPTELPKGIAPPSEDDDCDHDPPLPPDVFDLSPGKRLFVVCENINSHNSADRYWIVDQDGAKEASFAIPGRKPASIRRDNAREGDGTSLLFNSDITKDGLVVKSYVIGRGLSDCGRQAGWVWTGTAFQLAYLAEMDDCKGVPLGAWPVLYSSKLRTGSAEKEMEFSAP